MDNVSQLIGYACASTHGQDIAQQQTLLNQFGCQRIFEERVGGEYIYRLQLERLFDHLRAGDVIVVTSLDRLARSTTDLFNIAGKSKPWALVCSHWQSLGSIPHYPPGKRL